MFVFVLNTSPRWYHLLLVSNGLTVNRNGAKFNNRFNTVRKQERESLSGDKRMEEQFLVNGRKSWQLCQSILMIRLCVTTAVWFLMPQHFTHTSFRQRERAHFNHCDGFHTGSFVFHINKVAQRKLDKKRLSQQWNSLRFYLSDLFIHSSILRASVYPPIYSTTNPYTYWAICLSIDLFIYPPIHALSYKSIYPSHN